MPLRIAITAAAVRTALGDEPQEVYRAIKAGKTALGPIEGFDASGFGDLQAAQIWKEPETPEDDPALRILGPHGRLLDAVARQAHAAAGLTSFAREDVGLFVALGMVDAPIDDLATAALASREGGDAMSLRAFFGGAYRQVHPLWPLSMLSNVAVGQIAIDLDIRGDNVVFASDAAAGGRALLEAAYAVHEGRCRAALAAGVSGRVSPASLARRALNGGGWPGEGGGALVLEPQDAAESRGTRVLGYVLGGATGFGALPDHGASRALEAAGLDPGAHPEGALRAGDMLGELGAGQAATMLALTLAGWADSPGGGEPRRAVLQALGPDEHWAALVIEEAR